MTKNIYVTIVTRESQVKQSRKARSAKQLNLWESPQAKQLSLPLEPLESPQFKPQKPQISSISGTSPKERNRYRVMLGSRILGDRLTIDEALKLAKRGGR